MLTIDLIDRLLADLEALRLALVVSSSDEKPAEDANDDGDLVDTATASDRFGIPRDTVRWLCEAKGLGEKRGGRWMVSAAALKGYKREKRE